MSLLHQNIQCISNKILPLEMSLKNLDIDILLLTEHWKHTDELNCIHLSNYDLAANFCRKEKIHGGSAIYVKRNNAFKYKEVSCNNISGEGIMEACMIELVDLNMYVAAIYRPPSANFQPFLNAFQDLLESLNSDKKILIAGDFNLNFISNENNVILFRDVLDCYGFQFLINKPTRISVNSSTCIDNILINEKFNTFNAGIVDLNLSDHLAQTLTFKINKKKNFSKNYI